MEEIDYDNININTTQDDIIDKTFFKKYHCIEKIGQGSFGFIYKAEYNNYQYALKFENIKEGQNLLENEATIMVQVKGPNIPYIKAFGSCGGYRILVMQLLGQNLESLFQQKGSFSIKTVCLLGYQMLSVLESVHKKSYIHRDIKPDNFLMGIKEKSSLVYLLDFGLSKKYNPKNQSMHYIPDRDGNHLTGTARYASTNALRGLEQSRRDDLESLGYLFIYFLKGGLPWQGIQVKNKSEHFKKILVKKLSTSTYELCYGFPQEFEQFIDYCKGLEFDEEPDYEMLKELLIKVLKKERAQFDYIYDWSTYEEKQRAKEIVSNFNGVNINNKYNIEYTNENSENANTNYYNQKMKKNINSYKDINFEDSYHDNNIQIQDYEETDDKKEEERNQQNKNNPLFELEKEDDESKNQNKPEQKEELCCCNIF